MLTTGSSIHNTTNGVPPGAQFTHFAYDPNLAANVLYITLYGICFIAQFVLGVRYRSWAFLGVIQAGISLEIMGYTARISMRQNRHDRIAFLMSQCTLIIGPALLAASIYLSMGSLVRIFGQHLSRFKPRTYVVLFVAFDIVCLVLQAAGGAASSITTLPDKIKFGVDVIIAGLAVQVISLFVFILCGLEFAFNVQRGQALAETHVLRTSRRFRGFLLVLALATICVFVRSIFRIVELSQGFTGPLANDEVTFLVLEGAMILLATLVLTIAHPSLCLRMSNHTHVDPSKPRSLQIHASADCLGHISSGSSEFEVKGIQDGSSMSTVLGSSKSAHSAIRDHEITL